METKVSNAFKHQAMLDVLKNLTNINLSNKNVYGPTSLVDPSLSTAGDYAVNGVVATIAASSTVFALEDTVVPAYGGANFVLCLNAAGSGIGYATNVLTSAEVSTAGGTPATVRDAATITWPSVPATMTPVGIYTVIAGTVSHVSGSSTFSLVTSATGSHLFTQRVGIASV